jgi:hypothetical protein
MFILLMVRGSVDVTTDILNNSIMTAITSLESQLHIKQEETILPSQYDTFCKVIHKLNATSDIFYHTFPKNKYMFFQNLFHHELKTNEIDTCSSQTKILLYIFITSFQNATTINKFLYLKQVQNNPFLDETVKKLFFDLFCQGQTYYWRLNRFANSFKTRKMQLLTIHDLYMQPIDESDKHVITVIQENQKYMFTVTDIYKIIYSSITNSYFLFSDPQPVKNPYNNLPFSKSNLYNIYFCLKEKLLSMPLVFQHFFLCDFDLVRFEENSRVLLRELNIEQFIHSKDEIDKKCDLINDMFYRVDYNGVIIIDDKFPQERLVSIMKPYLNLYLRAEYSLDKQVRMKSRHILKKKLTAFYDYNSCFGRKIIGFQTMNHFLSTFQFGIENNNERNKTIHTYNDDHLPF